MFSSEYLAFGKPSFGAEEIEAVTRVLNTGWVGMGSETIHFENELAEFFHAKKVITVNSCTSALFLSLLVQGVGLGDEVICPSLTWCSTANAVLYLGATPVFCDVSPETLCVTPESILPRVTERTKAVLIVHMGGYAVDVDLIRDALPDHVVIIEDAAHALGAQYPSGKYVGASGNQACFSFYANKNLSTGEGGAIALSDELLAERLLSLRQSGLVSDAWKRYIRPESLIEPEIIELGYKMNYCDLLASVGRVQLRRQPEFSKRRMEIVSAYIQALDAMNDNGFNISYQKGVSNVGHARHLFVIKLPIESMSLSRDEVVLELRKKNIGASIHYTPLHKISLYEGYGRNLPVTDDLSKRIITLPIGSTMTLEDVDYVVSTLLTTINNSVRQIVVDIK